MAYIYLPLIKAFEAYKDSKRLEKARNRRLVINVHERAGINKDPLIFTIAPGQHSRREVVTMIKSDSSRRIPKEAHRVGPLNATIKEACAFIADAVKNGKLTIETASVIEDRLNTGKIKPAAVVREMRPLLGLEKSQRALTKDDAMNAVNRCLRAGVVTLEEAEMGLQRIRSGRISPRDAMQDCLKRVQGETLHQRSSQGVSRLQVPDKPWPDMRLFFAAKDFLAKNPLVRLES